MASTGDDARPAPPSGDSLVGRRLGPYRVDALIGRGGMGEVYKGVDTRLERIVAIKILPAHLAAQSSRRERFEREARTIASLNHPHICTLYDVGRDAGLDYLVLEHLEGETLAERLERGPLAPDQVLQFGVEVADALDKAHRKGIVHRDLKPANVMLVARGGPATKLLDFGLAKLRPEAAAGAIQSDLVTAAAEGVTAQGAILGTLQYMSPEQVEGREADSRSDIFALGAMLHEMATGRKAFEGASPASVVAKILESDPPPVSSLRPLAPRALDRVVRTCLAKDPEARWQSAADLARELRFIANSGPEAAAAAEGSSRVRRAGVALAAFAVGAALAGLAAWNLWRTPPSAAPIVRFTLTLPAGDRLATGMNSLALSPDGGRLAYAAWRGGVQQLFLRALDSLEARPLAGTEGAVQPFFSPDGRWLGFAAEGSLRKVAVEGGAPVTLTDLGGTREMVGASWSETGSIVFGRVVGGPLRQIPEAGGSAQPLGDVLEKSDLHHAGPTVLPGGRNVLFFAFPSGLIGVQPLGAGGGGKLVEALAGSPRYAASGHLLYTQGGNLMAAPFDAHRLRLAGAAVPVVDGVLLGHYSVSANGVLAYVAGVPLAREGRLVWVTRDGREQPLGASVTGGLHRLSPDGRRVAVSSRGQVWVYDVARESQSRFTLEGAQNDTPLWSPDGRHVAFSSYRPGSVNGLFWQRADGSGGLEQLVANEKPQAPTSWSPDGQAIAVAELDPAIGTDDVLILKLADRSLTPFRQTPFREFAAQFSPDGRYLAYVSDESGRLEVYVEAYPGPGARTLVSTDGGIEPLWSRDGRELFYRNGHRMMAVAVESGAEFHASRPRELFTGVYDAPITNRANYDVASDGRFLMIKPADEQEFREIHVVLNWFEELKRRATPPRR